MSAAVTSVDVRHGLPQRMVSYAGNREDVLLRRIFADQPTGFYVDVGAYHPVDCSTTKHFSDLGWSGINVEPIPERYDAFVAARVRDFNVQGAASDTSGKLTFYEVEDQPGLSTFDSETAADYREKGHAIVTRVIPVYTLNEVLSARNPATIDFISVDVEGHELAVLRGLDLHRWRPRVLVLEATKPWSTEPTHHAWEPLLLEAGYLFAAFDGVNRYYVHPEQTSLLERCRIPVNVLDNYVPHEVVTLERQVAELQRRLEQQGAIHPATRFAQWLAGLPRRLVARRRR